MNTHITSPTRTARVPERTRKGQMEAFGLAVIVVLIIIGFFIFVLFRAHERANTPVYHNEYITDQTPVKFVTAFVNLDVDECANYQNKQNIEKLIYDCATTQTIRCGTQDSCTIVNETLHTLLNATFVQRQSSFVIYTKGMGEHDIQVSYLGCTADATTEKGYTGMTIIALWPYAGNVEVYMAFCK